MTARDLRGSTRGVVGTLLVLLVAAACIRLGIWQLERLEERQALNALAAERLSRAPTHVALLPEDTAGAAWLRVRLEGSCEGEQIVLAARSRRGAPGVHLLCRFRTTGGRVVLLDRGWLPSDDARTVAPEAFADAPRDTTLEAVIVPFPGGGASARGGAGARLTETGQGVDIVSRDARVIYRLNRAEASAAAGVELQEWYAQALGPPDRLPIPADPPDLADGPHLGYAVQWFSFAAIALVGWLVLFLRRHDRAGRPAPPPPAPSPSRDEANS